MSEQTAPSPSATRARRYRQRQHEGVRIIRVEVDDRTIDALVEYGLLDQAHTRDRAEVALAIDVLLFALSEEAIKLDPEWIENPA